MGWKVIFKHSLDCAICLLPEQRGMVSTETGKQDYSRPTLLTTPQVSREVGWSLTHANPWSLNLLERSFNKSLSHLHGQCPAMCVGSILFQILLAEKVCHGLTAVG